MGKDKAVEVQAKEEAKGKEVLPPVADSQEDSP
jgi:hypothetical protein